MAPLNQPIDPTLAQLIQAAAASDSSTPTFFAVGPNGEPNAQFAGKIKAEGIELEERSNQEPQNSVEWKNKAGELRERISGWTNAKETENGPHILELLGFGKASRPAIQVIGHDLENHGVIVLVPGGTGPLAQLYNAEGGSNWPRLMDNSFFGVMNCGVATVNFGGGSRFSNSSIISHGLGVTPKFIHTEPASGFQGELLNAEKQSPNVVNFEARLQFPSFVPAAGPSTLYWIAIG